MSFDEHDTPDRECDHDWLDGECARCHAECECMDLNAASWDEGGHCAKCGMACDHGDADDGYCLTCGACLIEDMAAAAYDYAKGARYDD